LVAVVAVKQGGQLEGEVRLAVMAGESIYANVRLRLTANRTYEFTYDKLVSNEPFITLLYSDTSSEH